MSTLDTRMTPKTTHPINGPGNAQLACGHMVTFDPPVRLKDTVFCHTCDGWRMVIRTDLDWLYRCPRCTGGKSLTRRFGQDEKDARKSAQEHSEQYRHRVQLKFLGEIVETFSPDV